MGFSSCDDKPRAWRTIVLAALAMAAFAGNSLLCRLALGQDLLDAATFTTVRLTSGALTLSVIMALTQRRYAGGWSDWRPATMLFAYMVFFSFAYRGLNAGTGALVLFGAVQLTMFVFALRNREYIAVSSWIGLVLAVLGLVYLVSPGLTAPDPLGVLLMTIAGIAWGFYSLLGRGVADPLAATARNFAYSVPAAVVISLLFMEDWRISVSGLMLALASGAITSGCGYVIWYAALPGLTSPRAAAIQLAVPVLAAFGGVLLLSEAVTLRLLLASIAILGGVAIIVAQRAKFPGDKEAADPAGYSGP